MKINVGTVNSVRIKFLMSFCFLTGPTPGPYDDEERTSRHRTMVHEARSVFPFCLVYVYKKDVSTVTFILGSYTLQVHLWNSDVLSAHCSKGWLRRTLPESPDVYLGEFDRTPTH